MYIISNIVELNFSTVIFGTESHAKTRRNLIQTACWAYKVDVSGFETMWMEVEQLQCGITNIEKFCAALPLVWKLDSFKQKFPVVAASCTANVCTTESTYKCISFGRNVFLFSFWGGFTPHSLCSQGKKGHWSLCVL